MVDKTVKQMKYFFVTHPFRDGGVIHSDPYLPLWSQSADGGRLWIETFAHRVLLLSPRGMRLHGTEDYVLARTVQLLFMLACQCRRC